MGLKRNSKSHHACMSFIISLELGTLAELCFEYHPNKNKRHVESCNSNSYLINIILLSISVAKFYYWWTDNDMDAFVLYTCYKNYHGKTPSCQTFSLQLFGFLWKYWTNDAIIFYEISDTKLLVVIKIYIQSEGVIEQLY